MYSGSQQAATLASQAGCTASLRISHFNKLAINTLTNGKFATSKHTDPENHTDMLQRNHGHNGSMVTPSTSSWLAASIADFSAQALCFQIQLDMNSTNFPQPGDPIPAPDLAVQSVDCKGKYTCAHFIKQSDCQAAIAKFDNNTNYSALTIRAAITRGQLDGCVATYVCDANVLPSYFSGAEIRSIFAKLYEPTLVGSCKPRAICGNVWLNNGCHVTLGSCSVGQCHDNSYEGVPATSPAEIDWQIWYTWGKYVMVVRW